MRFFGHCDTLVPICSHRLKSSVTWGASTGAEKLPFTHKPLHNTLGKFHLIAKCCNPRKKNNKKPIKCQFMMCSYTSFSVWDGKSWRLYGINWASTVDGRNPAPPGMYKTLQIMGCYPYQLVQDFFHQPYHLIFLEHSLALLFRMHSGIPESIWFYGFGSENPKWFATNLI